MPIVAGGPLRASCSLAGRLTIVSGSFLVVAAAPLSSGVCNSGDCVCFVCRFMPQDLGGRS